MTNKEKLKSLLIEVLLLSDGEFRFDLLKKEVNTWDSLAVVALAVGCAETFGYHMKPEEAVSVKGVGDIMKILELKGINFNE